MNVFSVSLASRPLAMTAAPSAVIRLQVASNDNRILLCLRQSARATAPSFPRPFQEISTLFRRAFICGTDKVNRHTAPCFNIKAVFHQGRWSNYQDETVVRSFYVYNGNSYTGKTVYKTSRPRRPINQLGDRKTHLDGPLNDSRSLPSMDISYQQKRVHTVHYLNKPLNIDRATQHSSISGPSAGWPIIFAYFTHW